jgi:hypothetical protein
VDRTQDTNAVTAGLVKDAVISVALDGRRRKRGIILNPFYVSAHGHERIEYKDERGVVGYAKREDVRLESGSLIMQRDVKAPSRRHASASKERP